MATSQSRCGNRLLAALPEDEYARLYPYLSAQPLNKGHIIQRREQPLRVVFFPDDALIWLVNPTEDGSNAQVAMVASEGLVGVEAVFGSRLAMSDAVVHMTGANAGVALSVDVFRRELERRGALYTLAQQYAGALVQSLAQWVACSALHSAEQRCCRWLLEVEARIGRPELAVTHELLSDLLGLRRSTVTLIVGRLQELGIVSTNRGVIRIHDQRALEEHSCGCHKLVTTLFEEPPSSDEPSATAEHHSLVRGA